MLPGVTGQNHAGILVTGEAQEFKHLPATNLSGLVHDNQRASNNLPLEQKICDGRWRRKAGFFHIHDLLALWREHDHTPSRLLNLLGQITEDKTFTSASTASKN
jgi:hypothetical protein